MATNFPQAPGVFSGRSIAPRSVFASGVPQFYPSFSFLDGSKSRDTSNTDTTSLIQAGTLLGKITSGGNYRPMILGLISGAISSGTATSVTVTAATATEVARLIVLAGGNVSLKLVGPPTAGGTVAATAITCTAASGTTLTVSSVSLPAIVDVSLVTAADGSQLPSQILTETYGVDVLDINQNAVNSPIRLLRNGDINVTMIPYYSGLDSATQAYLKTQLRANNPGSVLTFSDDR